MRESNAFLMVGSKNFKSEVKDEKHAVLLACIHWGGGMKQQLELLKNVWDKYDEELKVCLMEEIQGRAVMEQLKIVGTPTYLIFKGGQEKDRIIGNVDTRTLMTFLNKNLPN